MAHLSNKCRRKEWTKRVHNKLLLSSQIYGSSSIPTNISRMGMARWFDNLSYQQREGNHCLCPLCTCFQVWSRGGWKRGKWEKDSKKKVVLFSKLTKNGVRNEIFSIYSITHFLYVFSVHDPVLAAHTSSELYSLRNRRHHKRCLFFSWLYWFFVIFSCLEISLSTFCSSAKRYAVVFQPAP